MLVLVGYLVSLCMFVGEWKVSVMDGGLMFVLI